MFKGYPIRLKDFTMKLYISKRSLKQSSIRSIEEDAMKTVSGLGSRQQLGKAGNHGEG
jgi:hypothetical protein